MAQGDRCEIEQFLNHPSGTGIYHQAGRFGRDRPNGLKIQVFRPRVSNPDLIGFGQFRIVGHIQPGVNVDDGLIEIEHKRAITNKGNLHASVWCVENERPMTEAISTLHSSERHRGRCGFRRFQGNIRGRSKGRCKSGRTLSDADRCCGPQGLLQG